MVLAAFSSKGKASIAFTYHKMDSAQYIGVMEKHLKPFWNAIRQPGLIFMQDNASIHKSKETQQWFQAQKIPLLEWPACSPDQNPIENCWGLLVREVYKDNRQFQTEADLKAAITEAWTIISVNTLEKLVESIPLRVFELIQNGGGSTHY